MLRENLLNILGTLAALALSFFLLTRTTTPTQTEPSKPIARAAAAADTATVRVLPHKPVIIRALRVNE